MVSESRSVVVQGWEQVKLWAHRNKEASWGIESVFFILIVEVLGVYMFITAHKL
jgi:hypothetical protein